ncbi:aldo/keto reductase [Streptomyces sp. ID05-04B]|uniref:aldo/keto reductase n=1 Tax=unclassified Streptomyces TaxID=2593676 RepID=UPI000D1AEBB5|nr:MULTISPECIES: aldo/keto reductase [unclassified Streptomyces]AVV44539.1 aldo/keto reductase [Streptomyces sp. P3]MDX5569456.1 aldo/keto reductase [Streptomyces sp. ID05-04B]
MRVTGLGAGAVAVSELALGCAALGNLYRPVSDDAARATVDAAWDVGIRTFDTAPHYGLGLSERRLGAALRDRPRDAYTLSTKVGRLLVPHSGAGDDLAHGFAVPDTHRRVWDFSADGVLRSLETSLERLGVDRVDVALLHDPDAHPEQALREAYPALERLRAEGVIGAIGVGMNQSALPARFVRETDIDVVLLAGRYTLLDQEGLAELLPQAAARGRAVVVGGVFNSGLLTAPRPGATYDYAPAPRPVLDRALRLLEVCERHGVPLRAAALRFPFGHPAVASVLTGARSPQEVHDTVRQLRRPIPDALWDELRAEGLLHPDAPVPSAAPSGRTAPAGHSAPVGGATPSKEPS